MKPFLSYGIAAAAMLALIFILISLVGLKIAVIIAAVIAYFGFKKIFLIPLKQ